MDRHRRLLALPAALAVALLALTPAGAGAEKYPIKPIRVIVALGAGGSHDLHARAVASVIHQYLGQPMVVQLMPGGGGKIGMTALKRAKPDGYTLALGTNSHMTIASQVRDMGFDPIKDFVPVLELNFVDYLLATRGNAPWKNFDEFVEAARRRPGQVSFGSSGAYGIGHLMILKVMADKKIKINHVPFAGGGPAMQALLGGHVDSGGANPATGGVIENYKSGRLRLLAVAGEKRNPLFPDVPTFREKGVDLVLSSWRTFLAPAGTPQERIDVLVEALKKLCKDRSFLGLLQKMGTACTPLYGPALAKKIRGEYESYGAIFRGVGIGKKK